MYAPVNNPLLNPGLQAHDIKQIITPVASFFVIFAAVYTVNSMTGPKDIKFNDFSVNLNLAIFCLGAIGLIHLALKVCVRDAYLPNQQLGQAGNNAHVFAIQANVQAQAAVAFNQSLPAFPAG